jgi:hypothetical protein
MRLAPGVTDLHVNDGRAAMAALLSLLLELALSAMAHLHHLGFFRWREVLRGSVHNRAVAALVRASTKAATAVSPLAGEKSGSASSSAMRPHGLGSDQAIAATRLLSA